ncbi:MULTISPECIES: hypothetical protein [unclassified Streptomyces]|uniref:hypothetical protein n=1 Tax=unclassified Streptomyces TaxID=2593676 RepID=UPI0033925B1B
MVARAASRNVISDPAEVTRVVAWADGIFAGTGACADQGWLAYRIRGLRVGIRSCLVDALGEGAVFLVEVAVAVQVRSALVEG